MRARRRGRSAARTLLAWTLPLALVGALAGCTDDGEPEPGPAPSPTGPATPVELTLGVYGSKAEVAAFSRMVDAYNDQTRTRQVELVSWPDHDTALDAVVAGEAPDIFMTARGDLAQVVEAKATQPLGLLLDERGVDFGDQFVRSAVESFAVDDALQCMAYSVSPMVIYYNTDLVDFERMERRGLPVPSDLATGRWSIEDFTAAAEFASRGRAAGVHIDPTLPGLAPFIYSGGGQVFDDATDPTSLAFSEDDTRAALETTLAVLRDPAITLTEDQLERRSALEWFERGRLGMIAGYRDLVPRLREVPDLDFDVLAMPTLDSAATVGQISGLCISREVEDAGAAADFLAWAVSDEAVSVVTEAGYLQPANLVVSGSDTFLQPDAMPEHATVFTSALRGIVLAPLLEDPVELQEAVAARLEQLLNQPGVLDLEELTAQIDRESQAVLSPEEVEPSDGATESETAE